MNLGPDAIKTALNLVSAICFAGVALRYALWMHRDWHDLKGMALGTLPLSVALLMVVGAVSSAYYGAARILLPYGVDLRSYLGIVTALGVAALAGVALHMVAIWRSDGVPVMPRVIRCGAIIAGLWAGLAWVLW